MSLGMVKEISMKTFGRTILMAGALTAVSFAQQWEFGGSAGGGFLNTVNANNSFGSATAGFQSGAAFGAFLGYNSSNHLGGELRYGYMQSDLKLSSGGQTATFAGQSHEIGRAQARTQLTFPYLVCRP